MWKFCYPARKLKIEGELTEKQFKQMIQAALLEQKEKIKKEKLEIERKIQTDKENAKKRLYNEIRHLFSSRIY